MGWGVQGDGSGDPIQLVGSTRRSGRGLKWLRLGRGVGERGHRIQGRGIQRLVSPLLLTSEIWVREARPNCHQAGGRASRQGRRLWLKPSGRANPAPPPSRRVRAGRATARRVPRVSAVALSSSPSLRVAPTPGLTSSRTRFGPERARAVRARGAARARAPATSAPPRL